MVKVVHIASAGPSLLTHVRFLRWCQHTNSREVALITVNSAYDELGDVCTTHVALDAQTYMFLQSIRQGLSCYVFAAERTAAEILAPNGRFHHIEDVPLARHVPPSFSFTGALLLAASMLPHGGHIGVYGHDACGFGGVGRKYDDAITAGRTQSRWEREQAEVTQVLGVINRNLSVTFNGAADE